MNRRSVSKLKNARDETRQIGAILLDSDMTPADRFAALQPFTEHVYASGVAIPQPELRLARNGDGRFNFKFNVGLGKSQGGFSDSIRKLVQSPQLSTESGVKILLRSRIAMGSFSEFDRDPDTGNRRLRWFTVQADTLDPATTQIDISPEGQLTAVRFDQLMVDRIRYGHSDSFLLRAPEWPDRTAEEHDTVAPDIILRLITAVSSAIENRRPAGTSPAR